MLEAAGLVKRFGGFTAVDGCSLTVEERSLTGLIGPNGAGKTTLFNLLGGYYRPDGGAVRFKGRDISRLKPHQRFAAGITRTFQIPHEFQRMTVLENLTVVPPAQSGEGLFAAWFRPFTVARQEAAVVKRAREVLDFLKLTHVESNQAGALSGGQKKLLELGRAIMSGNKCILLDEPAAGVNRTLLAELAERIAELHRTGYTFLIIEHDMEFVGHLCRPIYVMAEGKVLTKGSMADIRADHRVVEAYLGSQGSA
ncbi:MAG: ABC transporter ATP-binding protein [Alphaproteobacteria bacterium]|nr:ABC transporter ATP-binding protein [Alphaproteobacteria bacterium]TAD87775.1 MAG: ABC transporter ATP-binding protein [Alphaproteobacteria bacterium]